MNRILRFITYQSIMDEPLPPIDWLVESLISNGDRVVVYGEWETYKSWLLMHLALHLSAGKDWLGHFLIPTPKRVLYIDEEMSEITFRRRWKQLAIGAGLDNVELPLVICPQPGLVCTEQGPRLLLEQAQTHGCDPEVIIIETFTRIMKGDENTAKDVSQFWRNLKPLHQGRTIILSHHMGKPSETGGRATRDRARGSTDIMAGCDTALAIKKTKSGLITVEQVKSRAAEKVGQFTLRFVCEGEDEPASFTMESPPEFSQTSQPDGFALIDEFMKGRDIVKSGEIIQFLDGKDIAERSAQRILQAYVKAGKIVKVKKGQWRKPQPPLAA